MILYRHLFVWLNDSKIDIFKKECGNPFWITYSPYMQMALFLSAISYAHSSCWPMTTFCHTLYMPAVCSYLYLIVMILIMVCQQSIPVWSHPKRLTLACRAAEVAAKYEDVSGIGNYYAFKFKQTNKKQNKTDIM